MRPLQIRERADWAQRAGFADLARHLRGLLAGLGFPLPPRRPPVVDLPALDGLTSDDLESLGVPWRRTRDGVVIEVPARRFR